MKLRRN